MTQIGRDELPGQCAGRRDHDHRQPAIEQSSSGELHCRIRSARLARLRLYQQRRTQQPDERQRKDDIGQQLCQQRPNDTFGETRAKEAAANQRRENARRHQPEQ